MASGEDTSAENEKDENFLPPLDKHPTTAKVVMFSSWLEPTPGRFRPRMAVRSETKAVNGYNFPYFSVPNAVMGYEAVKMLADNPGAQRQEQKYAYDFYPEKDFHTAAG